MKHPKPQDPEFYYVDHADYRRKVDDYTAITDTWISTEKGLPHTAETVLVKLDYDGGYAIARRDEEVDAGEVSDSWYWVGVDEYGLVESARMLDVVTDWKRILAPVRDVNGK